MKMQLLQHKVKNFYNSVKNNYNIKKLEYKIYENKNN